MSASPLDPARPGPAPDVEALRRGLLEGEPELIAWLRRRAGRKAAPQFAGWAWEWIEEDFLSDLVVQLTVTVRKPGFTLRGTVGTYVDTAVQNLCHRYFQRIARMRRADPLDAAGDPPDRSCRRVAAALEMRRVLLALSRGCRQLLVDKYVHGLSLAEIAGRIGIEAKTVRSRLHACRGRAREILQSPPAAINKTAALDSEENR